MAIIPISRVFDQQTLAHMLSYDPVVQFYREFFALLDWSVVPDPSPTPTVPASRRTRKRPPSKPGSSKSARSSIMPPRLCTSLLRHPLLVLEIGFRPYLNVNEPYGFEVERTVPSARWLREKQRRLDRRVLHALLAAMAHALQEAVPILSRNGGLRRAAHLRLGQGK